MHTVPLLSSFGLSDFSPQSPGLLNSRYQYHKTASASLSSKIPYSEQLSAAIGLTPYDIREKKQVYKIR